MIPVNKLMWEFACMRSGKCWEVLLATIRTREWRKQNYLEKEVWTICICNRGFKPTGTSGIRAALQNCPKLKQEDWIYTALHCLIIRCRKQLHLDDSILQKERCFCEQSAVYISRSQGNKCLLEMKSTQCFTLSTAVNNLGHLYHLLVSNSSTQVGYASPGLITENCTNAC